jgi:hypothetical protein
LLAFSTKGLGSMVWALGFMVYGLGLWFRIRVYDLGFRV